MGAGEDPGRGEPGRAGPVFDDAMKAVIAGPDLGVLLAGLPLRGLPVPAGSIGPAGLDRELHGSAVRVDLLAGAPGLVVHGEFVKAAGRDLPWRMVDYRLRILREHPHDRIVQFVLVLDETLRVPDRFATPDGVLGPSWQVIRAADLDPRTLLAHPSTAALAALTAGTPQQRAELLRAAVRVIAAGDPARRTELLRAAATLASIVLSRPIIEGTLQEVFMPVPIIDTPLGRHWYDTGREEGREEGRRQEATTVAKILLRRRFGDDPRIEAVARRLLDLPDEERLDLLTSAATLEALVAELPALG